MKTNDQSKIFTRPLVMALLATICCLLWGSAFPAIKLGYRWFDISAEATGTQILFAGFRFTLAGILTVIIGSILARKIICSFQSISTSLFPFYAIILHIFKICHLWRHKSRVEVLPKVKKGPTLIPHDIRRAQQRQHITDNHK